MQATARAPAMTAMTAMSVNALSGGRFILGLGASGPQLVEGFHGASFEAPLTRLRETVEICRMAFAGEKLRYDGRHYVLPRPGGEGRALRLSHPPAEIPIYLATLRRWNSPAKLPTDGSAIRSRPTIRRRFSTSSAQVPRRRAGPCEISILWFRPVY